MRNSVLTLVLGLSTLSFPALADTTLRYRITGTQCLPDTPLWQFTRSFMRSENELLGTSTTNIFDSLEKLSYVLDPKQKTFYQAEVDLDAAEFQGDVLAAMNRHAKRTTGADSLAAISNCNLNPHDTLPGELPSCDGKDPLFDGKRLLDGKRNRVDRDIGEAKINGISCQQREHLRDGKLLRTDCRTSLDKLNLDKQEQSLVERISRYQISAAKLTHDQTHPDLIEKGLERLVLVQRICHEGSDKESGRAELEVSHTTIPQSQFEVPAGYTYRNPFEPASSQRPNP